MFSSPKEEAKEEVASSATTPQPSSTIGDNDVPGTSASDAIRRNLAEMESSFFDSPSAQKSFRNSSSFFDRSSIPAAAKDEPPSSGKSENRFSGLGITPIAARTQTLALKEQENIVDKYQKENFSLKMKLYYLEKRLTQLNDEEVKRMIAENIELSTYKISAAKEIKALNKRIRELQFDVNDRDARLETQSRATQQQSEIANDNDGARYDTEQELSFMRDRLSTYEIEIAHLRDQMNGTVDGRSDPSARPRSNSGSVISLRRHEAEIESLELSNGHLRDTLSELKMENHELTRQVETMNEDMAKFYDHVNANADDSILERSASRARARGNSGSSGKGYDAELESLELANGQLRDAQSLLRMQNVELNGQLDLLTEEVTKLHAVENSYNQLQLVYSELLDEVERLQGIEDQLTDVQQENVDLQAAFEGLHKEKQNAIDWAKILTTRIETMTNELTDFADMKQQFDELQETHQELQDQLEGTVRTLKSNEQRQSQIDKIRKSASEKMTNLEEMISKKEAELAVLRSENAGLNQHEGEMYTRMDQLSEELEASKKEVEKLKAESMRLAGHLEREKALRHSQRASQEQALKQQQQHQQPDVGLVSVRNARITELEARSTADKKKQEALERQFKARLQELEKRLVQEREGRLVDRKGARARLLEGERENNELKEKLRKLTEKAV